MNMPVGTAARRCIATMACALLVMMGGAATAALAEESDVAVTGQVYELEGDGHYVLDEALSSETSSSGNAIGQLTLSGSITSDESSAGVPSYTIGDGVIALSYTFDQSSLGTDESGWCITDDNTKKVDGLQLGSNILSGAIVLQTSLDGETWVTESVDGDTDILSEDSTLGEPFYTATDIQLQNGCYYRVYVAYKMQRNLDSTRILLWDVDDFEYKKVAEVYEFYASYAETGASASDTPRKTLGTKTKTGNDNGYSGSQAVTSDDPHYGWDIGEFFINGYTRQTSDDSGNTYFLKNVGDKVTLWFTLEQDIDCLDGDSSLSIADDTNGYDQYFETEKTDFGRGTLIIQYTDEEGVKHDPIIYTNYLAASARTGADTKVQLFEEGDYEVSLDYEIVEKVGPGSLIPVYTSYKVSFSFSIRNGNCMVYPFDVVTGSELADRAITENGFTLDMAKSKYLTIDVTRSTLTMGSDGQLVEDVRFNRPAKDGDQYTDEGIYTFVVRNLYTGESTTKTIYVGSDQYLSALSSTGYTVEEMNALLAQGATLSEIVRTADAKTADDSVEAESEGSEPEGSADDEASGDEQSEEASEPEAAASSATDEAGQGGSVPAYAAAIVLALALLAAIALVVRRRRGKRE